MKGTGTNTEKIFSYLDTLKAYSEGGYELQYSTTTLLSKSNSYTSSGRAEALPD